MSEKPLFETNPPKELNFDTDESTNNFEEFIGLSLGVLLGKKLKLGRYNKVGLSDIALEFQWEKTTKEETKKNVGTRKHTFNCVPKLLLILFVVIG